jgi:hypothetical protein
VKKGPGLLDTGPLVSFLAAGLRHHAWAFEQWKLLRPPLLTCDPVLTEAAFLLKREGREADPLSWKRQLQASFRKVPWGRPSFFVVCPPAQQALGVSPGR